MIPSEYRDILYLILKVLNRPLKWDTVGLWTPTGSASTGRQSWRFEKNLRFSTKTNVFLNVQLWRLVFFNPVEVQRRTVSHFKGLFKTFKMRYSTFLYSYWISLHVHFKKAILHLKRAFVKYVSATTVLKDWIFSFLSYYWVICYTDAIQINV